MLPTSITPNSLTVQVDGQTATSWSDIVAQFDDASVYQSLPYGTVRWGERNLSHLVLRRDGQIVAAAQLRIARVPFLPAGVAYLRWGPLCQRKGQPFDPAIIKEMVKCLRDEYCGKRKLTLQVLPNTYPYRQQSAAYTEAFVQSNMQPDQAGPTYRTVLVDLSPPVETIREQFNQKTRRCLKKAEKNNLVIEVSDGAAAYRDFVQLYGPMRERKQFDSDVDVDEFGRIQEQLLGTAKMQTFLVRIDNEPIGALVISLTGDTAIYLLGATNEKARDLLASYFLHWQALNWIKERGGLWYDLGGIDPAANPGGFDFKSGFGGMDVTQLVSHSHQGGLLSQAAAKFISWRRRRHLSAKPPAASAPKA